MMLDIDGQEFSIHEHSLSPVSERTELDTNSSQASSKRQQKPPSISQALLSKRYSPQTKFSSTAPLCLSPKAATNLLSPPSSTSSASPSNLNRSNQANSSHSISPQDVDHSSSPNLTERAKLFGNSKPIRKKREVCSEKKTSEPEHDFSPKFSHNSFGASSQSNYHSHPSLQRVPKRTTQLIQLFESGSSPTSPTHSMLNTEAISRSKSPANRAQLSSGEKISPIEALEASRRARNARNQRIKPSLPQYPALAAEGHYSLPPSSSPEVRSSETCIPTSPSLDSINTNAVLEPSQAELEHMKLRTERRERTAQAENVRLNSLPKKAKDLPPSTEQRSPMSDEFIRHRKSIASSVTSNFSESKVLISGMIWYRNPQSQKWKETRGILTPKALYLANEGGEIDPASPGQSIELDLTGCTSVESIRSKRSYGPDFSEPHLHLLRITWAEFDHRINSRVEHEEFLACGRATQRADWASCP
ncbi:expressed protein [Phakopsora pachyrhizi]|uniref:Expressed protein n=1 Tax=Phakopsora pachyrhizi TaxID=170000 RepID=A0AAV0BSX6_PHAPC|nr:expressed protein [Phakopsora pachyrhizi]